MKCPNCRKQATAAHLRESPECAAHIRSLNAILNASQRKTFGGGRPKKTPEKQGGKYAE